MANSAIEPMSPLTRLFETHHFAPSLGNAIMSTNPSPNPERFQFTLRTLLIVVTVACVLLAILYCVLPKSLPLEFRIALNFMVLATMAYSVPMIDQAKRRPWKTPENYVTVKVDAKWQRRVKSPFIFGPIAALTGVSLTFAPLFLLWCGQVQNFGIFEWIAVPLCLLMIYIVPGFYMRLASEVIAELLKSETLPKSSQGRIKGVIHFSKRGEDTKESDKSADKHENTRQRNAG